MTVSLIQILLLTSYAIFAGVLRLFPVFILPAAVPPLFPAPTPFACEIPGSYGNVILSTQKRE